MAKKKLEAIVRSKPRMLMSREEKQTELDLLIEGFRRWFDTVPGGEWKLASVESRIVYVWWHAVPAHPEWGKAFVAFPLDDERNAMQQICHRVNWPVDMPHWQWLDVPPYSSLEVLREAYAVMYRRHPNDRQWTDYAYHRCLGDLFHS